MNAKDMINQSLGMADRVLNAYVADLNDADLLLHPVAGQNHIAWQLGHLISSERMFIEGVKPGSCPPLPAGFDEAHNKEATKSADNSRFLSKQKYLELYTAQRAATKSALESLSDADLDAPGAERFRNFLPTVGSTFEMIGLHALMHVGQFVSVRRTLNKPVVI